MGGHFDSLLYSGLVALLVASHVSQKQNQIRRIDAIIKESYAPFAKIFFSRLLSQYILGRTLPTFSHAPLS